MAMASGKLHWPDRLLPASVRARAVLLTLG